MDPYRSVTLRVYKWNQMAPLCIPESTVAYYKWTLLYNSKLFITLHKWNQIGLLWVHLDLFIHSQSYVVLEIKRFENYAIS